MIAIERKHTNIEKKEERRRRKKANVMCDFSLFFVDISVQCKATIVNTINYTCTIETKNGMDENSPRKRKKHERAKKHGCTMN